MRDSWPCCCLPFQVAIYAGFLAELYAWFCIGEIVGRGGSLTGEWAAPAVVPPHAAAWGHDGAAGGVG